MKAPETIKFDVSDRVACITLNRPDRLNAIGPQMVEELFEALEATERDPDIWIAVLMGEGRAFSSGFDMGAIAAGRPSERGDSRTLDELYEFVAKLKKPLIAAVNGLCLGPGAGLALLADVRFAAEEASFGWPQVRRGMVSTSGPAILAHRVPLGFAFKLLFSGKSCTAAEALAMGMVQEVVPGAELKQRALGFAHDIADNCAPIAVRTIKESTLANLHNPDLAQRIARTAAINAGVRGNRDSAEGMAAYAERRPAEFKGT